MRERARTGKLASRQKIVLPWRCVFVLAAYPVEASGEKSLAHGERASGESLYNYFRDYDPTTGRYRQSDPLGMFAGLNTYAYVGGKPLAFIDVLGLAEECIKKLMLVTSYNDIGPGKDWKHYKPKNKGDKPGSVGPGTIAVANTDPKPYPFGCKMKVLSDKDGKPEYEGEVHDTGAGWDKKHHNVAPGEWIDIWLPGKDANKFGKQWRVVEVCCEACP